MVFDLGSVHLTRLGRLARPLWARPLLTARSVAHELAGAARLAEGPPSFVRYAGDIILYRVMRLAKPPSSNRERTIRLKGGIEIAYRLNRGDIQGIREVWIDEAYRLPFELDIDVVIDLGANIGLTSLFLAGRYGCTTIIAVEPDPSNAALTRRNLVRNGATAEVLQAAAGPEDGVGCFESNEESNLGHLSGTGQPVQIISMETLLAMTPDGFADLVKIDIEGGEEALLGGDISWLQRVGSIIVEFHPVQVDYPGLVNRLQQAGFRYVPANSAWPGSMDGFFRAGWTAFRAGGKAQL